MIRSSVSREPLGLCTVKKVPQKIIKDANKKHQETT